MSRICPFILLYIPLTIFSISQCVPLNGYKVHEKKYQIPKGSVVPVIVIKRETWTMKIVLKNAEQNLPLRTKEIRPRRTVNPSTKAPQTSAATFSP